MNQVCSDHTSKDSGINRLWVAVQKGTALVAIAVALIIGMTGCSLDDILLPIGGDIPFEQEYTTPTEMGSVDNAPTVPDGSSFDNVDDRPL